MRKVTISVPEVDELVEKVLFIGSKTLGLQILREMHSLDANSLIGAITIDDRKDSRSVLNEITEYCSRNSLQLYIVENREQFGEVIHELKPELCFVVCWYWLVSKSILSSVPKGFIGVHNSLLPKYRGGSPLVWQLIRGEKKVGFSVFSLTEDMDAGDIWGQKTVEVTTQDYIKSILTKIEGEVIDWFRKNYINILNESLKPIPQDHTQATFCAQRFPFDGQIDWSKSSMKIYNYIRAQSEPYPGSFTYFRGKRLTIWRAHPSDMVYYGEIGQVARIDKDGVYVICGDQSPIRLETVQLEDETKKAANEVIRSIRIRFQSRGAPL